MATPGTAFPPLDTLLNSMRTMEQTAQQQPKLWDPRLQTDFTGRVSGQAVTIGSPETGKAVMAVPAQRQQDLFLNNYVRRADGVQNLQVGMQNAAQVHRQASVVANVPPTEHTCKVYPPLLVRYRDPAQPGDQYVPVELFAGGEMRYTRGFPDLILNFHSDTRAITVTVCQIDARKWSQYQLAMQTLYSMTVVGAETTLTVPEFTALYDNVRYNLLRSLALKTGRPA